MFKENTGNNSSNGENTKNHLLHYYSSSKQTNPLSECLVLEKHQLSRQGG